MADRIIWANERRKLSELIAWESNPRLIKKDEAKRLVDSLDTFGQIETIAIDPTNLILDGHQREKVWGAAKQYGPDYEVDVRVASRPLTEKEHQKLVVYLHKGAQGEFDWEMLGNNFEMEDLIEWGFSEKELTGCDFGPAEEADAEPQIDKAAELQKKWQTESGQLWRIGEHRLLCGDSTKAEDVDRLMAGEKAEMCFTDPPWNVAIGLDSNPRHRQRAGLQNDNLSEADFTAFLSAFAELLPDAISGDLYCVLGASEWPTLDLALRSAGFHWSATVIWVKDAFVLGRSNYHRRYEPLWYGWHKNGKSSWMGARNVDDVWEIPRPKVSEEHPTMKPVELVARAIKNSSGAGGGVLDPFCGSGTTMVACENLGRKCRAIEIAPGYCAVILERMATAFPGIEIEQIPAVVDSSKNVES